VRYPLLPPQAGAGEYLSLVVCSGVAFAVHWNAEAMGNVLLYSRLPEVPSQGGVWVPSLSW